MSLVALRLSAILSCILLGCSGCSGGIVAATPDTGSLIAQPLLQGRYDNREQAGSASVDNDRPVPHVTVVIEPLSQPNWTLWHVHLAVDPESVFDQTWAMQLRREHDGSRSLIPYYQFKQIDVPNAATFDAQQWLPLEACALRGRSSKTRIEGMSEGEPCVAVTMSVGARRALLPVGIVREGDWLHLDLTLRGVRTRIDAKRS